MGRVRHDSGSGEDSGIERTFIKGPWTSEEDQCLIDYVDKHGEGNWNSVQKHSGLSRCGKSCRLRWVNHLRPDLKKGAFTEKEEQRVIELHAAMGNKWARMAAELPGRTDNEIKNFWNTRLKRLQRLGLPIYPDDVRQQAMNAAAQTGLNSDSLDAHHTQKSLEPDSLEIPELDFKLLPLSQCSSYYQSMIRSVPTSSLLIPRPCFFQPSFSNIYNNLIPPPRPYMPPNRKRLREPETAAFPPCIGGYATNDHWNYPNYPFVDTSSDSHLLGNATYSSPSGPLINGAEKLELPSFQYFEPPGGWGIQDCNPMPALESDNTFVQTPLTPSADYPSTLYDGLPGSGVYGSSGGQRTTETDSESALLQSSLLDPTELPPASTNTAGIFNPPNCPSAGHKSDLETYWGYFESSERPTPSSDAEWLSRLLGQDKEDTN